MNIKESLEASARFNAAFPSTHKIGMDRDAEIFHPGLSKRELFAALAMVALYTNDSFVKAASEISGTGEAAAKLMAKSAIQAADELLNKLEEPIK